MFQFFLVYVCMYVFMYVCMYLCMYVYMYVCIDSLVTFISFSFLIVLGSLVTDFLDSL